MMNFINSNLYCITMRYEINKSITYSSLIMVDELVTLVTNRMTRTAGSVFEPFHHNEAHTHSRQ